MTPYCRYVLNCAAVCRLYPEDIATRFEQPGFTNLLQKFIYNQEHLKSDSDTSLVDLRHLPEFCGEITVYTSAIATFYAPSDISGVGGMRRERIHAVETWWKGPGRYDTVFVSTDPSKEGMLGLEVARVRLFFFFNHNRVDYPCALVDWYTRVGDSPNEKTGMWIVEPTADTLDDFSESRTTILHLDTIVRAAHLIPVFGHRFVSRTLSVTDTLNEFTRFYVNKYADHHSFETAF